MCDHVLIGLSFVPALVVCTLPVVVCVGIEPGRAAFSSTKLPFVDLHAVEVGVAMEFY